MSITESELQPKLPSQEELLVEVSNYFQQAEKKSPLFEHMAIVPKDNDYIEYELDGEKQQVKSGYYGNYSAIDGNELVKVKERGMSSLLDWVHDTLKESADRSIKRIECEGWLSLFSNKQFVATSWQDCKHSNPIADLKRIFSKPRNTKIFFPKMYMNRYTYNTMLASAEFHKSVGNALLTAELDDPKRVNLLLKYVNLPDPVIFDEGYVDEEYFYKSFIPDGIIIMLASDDSGNNTKPIEYQLTKNALNNYTPNHYCYLDDKGDELQLHLGHNGGVAIVRPDMVITLDVLNTENK